MLLSIDQGKLEKMVVWAYEVDPSTNRPIRPSQEDGDKYQVLLNPESYTLNQLVLRDMRQGHGTSGTETRYLGNAPANFEFKILFDGTGAVQRQSEGLLSSVPVVGALADAISGGGKELSVMEEIERFNNVVYSYDSERHGPRLCAICWGDLIIEFASLTSLNFDFKLFGADGKPLRAFATATFVESPPDNEREVITPSHSPDVTKSHIVRAGDSLPMLAEKYYSDPALYIEIARVNGIINFRDLEPGTRILLPAIDKS